MSSKGFLNLNRFKSGKTIKQQTKRIADDSRNKPITIKSRKASI
jgi:hypothetical protein